MGVNAKEFFKHIDAYMDYRKTVYEVSDQTLKSNHTDLRLFESFIQGRRYKKITGPVAMKFQYYLKKDRDNCGGSLNRKLFSLRSFSHFLRLQEVAGAEHLPFYDILKSRQGYRNRPNALTDKQLKMLFDAIDRETYLGIRDYVIYALMYLCGLRVGEIFDLNLDSIDLKNKKLFVIGKGKKHRNLHLNKEMFQILSEYIAVRSFFLNSDKSFALFISKKGNRLAIRTMEDNFKKIVNKSGLNVRFNVSCHTLRHTFASHLNDEEVSMLVIQSLMGHASSRSTEPYIHPSSKRVKEAMERLPGVIFMNKLINKKRVSMTFQKRITQRE